MLEAIILGLAILAQLAQVQAQDDTNQAQSPTEAGASGPDGGSFHLSNGALIAIIIVVVIVVVLGTASAVLFFLAKRRGWNARESFRRASRRLTGRYDATEKANRQSRRTGVRMASPPPGKTRERDLEKGRTTRDNERMATGKPMGTTATVKSTFDVETPSPQPTKSKLFGSLGRK